jgi:hypothetical protein
MGLDGLWKPDLRARIEAQIRDVAAGVVTKAQVGRYYMYCIVYVLYSIVLHCRPS